MFKFFHKLFRQNALKIYNVSAQNLIWKRAKNGWELGDTSRIEKNINKDIYLIVGLCCNFLEAFVIVVSAIMSWNFQIFKFLPIKIFYVPKIFFL